MAEANLIPPVLIEEVVQAHGTPGYQAARDRLVSLLSNLPDDQKYLRNRIDATLDEASQNAEQHIANIQLVALLGELIQQFRDVMTDERRPPPKKTDKRKHRRDRLPDIDAEADALRARLQTARQRAQDIVDGLDLVDADDVGAAVRELWEVFEAIEQHNERHPEAYITDISVEDEQLLRKLQEIERGFRDLEDEGDKGGGRDDEKRTRKRKKERRDDEDDGRERDEDAADGTRRRTIKTEGVVINVTQTNNAPPAAPPPPPHDGGRDGHEDDDEGDDEDEEAEPTPRPAPQPQRKSWWKRAWLKWTGLILLGSALIATCAGIISSKKVEPDKSGDVSGGKGKPTPAPGGVLPVPEKNDEETFPVGGKVIPIKEIGGEVLPREIGKADLVRTLPVPQTLTVKGWGHVKVERAHWGETVTFLFPPSVKQEALLPPAGKIASIIINVATPVQSEFTPLTIDPSALKATKAGLEYTYAVPDVVREHHPGIRVIVEVRRTPGARADSSEELLVPLR